ncbi:MAG: PAS domain S-box protein [Anaerolineae bacterium]
MDLSDSFARRLLDGLFVFAGLLTPEGTLIEANRAALESANLNPQDVVGKRFEDTYWWSYSPAVQKELRQAIDRACKGDPVRYDALIRVGETRFIFLDFSIAPILDDHGTVRYLLPSGADITEQKYAKEAPRLSQPAAKGAPLKNADGTLREWVGAFDDIAERRGAEEALRDSERFLTSVVDATPGLIYIYDLNAQRNVYTNDQLGSLFGYTPSEAQQDGFHMSVLHPEDGDIVWGQVARIRSARDGEVLEAAYRLRHKSGEWRWIYDRETVFKRDEDGNVVQVLGIAEDITSRKQAEEALQRANVLFEQAEAAAGGFVYEWDVTTNVVQRSAGVKAILGYEPDEIEGTARGWRSLIHPEDTERLNRIRPGVLAEREQINNEYRVRHKDGHYIWVWERGIIHRDADGKPLRVIGSTVDITERKQAEEAVRRSELRFRALRDSNVIGIVYANFDGRIIEANDAYLRMMGYSREELDTGEIDWHERTPSEWRERDAEALAAMRATGRATPWEKEYYRKDGSRVPVLIGATLMNARTGDVMAFILDISERKKLEQRKDDFIALASHELKTPITSLKTYTQVLRRRFEGTGEEDAVRLVSRMETQINRLVEVVQDLLDASRIQDGKLELNLSPFVMDDLVSEIVGELQPITAHELRIEAGAGEMILADRDRIRQVLINLIFNAVTYSPKTQPIVLRTWSDTDGTHVSVIDHGVGIPRSEQTKIFDRFYQMSSSSGKTYPGLGLGLFISSEIMKRHRGLLTVESEVGRGSTFTLTLPRSSDGQGEQTNEQAHPGNR